MYMKMLYIQWNLSNPTPRDQGNVSDCTGWRNTQVLFMLTELLWDHKFLSDVTGCRKTQVSDCTGSTVYIYIIYLLMICTILHMQYRWLW